jgi:hypothetical protein
MEPTQKEVALQGERALITFSSMFMQRRLADR